MFSQQLYVSMMKTCTLVWVSVSLSEADLVSIIFVFHHIDHLSGDQVVDLQWLFLVLKIQKLEFECSLHIFSTYHIIAISQDGAQAIFTNSSPISSANSFSCLNDSNILIFKTKISPTVWLQILIPALCSSCLFSHVLPL